MTRPARLPGPSGVARHASVSTLPGVGYARARTGCAMKSCGESCPWSKVLASCIGVGGGCRHASTRRIRHMPSDMPGAERGVRGRVGVRNTEIVGVTCEAAGSSTRERMTSSGKRVTAASRVAATGIPGVPTREAAASPASARVLRKRRRPRHQ
jgi:hypothetical protein